MARVRAIRNRKPVGPAARDCLRRPSGRRLLRVILVLLAMGCLFSDPFHAEAVAAKAAVVVDAATGKILFAKNPHLRLPPASTTKLVTAMVALDRMTPDAVVTISDHAAKTPSVSPRLRRGERFAVRDLLALSLMRSVNGAAVALAEGSAGSEEAFVALMNEKALRTGAENTHFINASGLPGEGQSITAYDLTGVMREALSYPLIREMISMKEIRVRSLDGRRIVIKNTNSLLWSDDDLLGGKTGYTKAARHCFVCAAEKGQNTLIVAILGEAARDGLWHETSLLLEKGQDVLSHKAEPMIYLSSPRDRVLLASYTPRGSGADRDHKIGKPASGGKADGATKKKAAKGGKTPKKKKNTAKAPVKSAQGTGS